MKSLLFVGIGVVMVLLLTSEVVRFEGSPGGYSNSIGDGRNCTQCHARYDAIAKEGWITSDIPAEGYTPGQTYTITLTITDSGMKDCGFEMTLEDSKDAKMGGFAVLAGQGTQLIKSGNSVTHTYQGTSPSNGSKSWEISWTAPAEGSGSLIFSASTLAGDGGSDSDYDQVYTTNLFVSEKVANDISNNGIASSTIYYNYESSLLQVEGPKTIDQIEVYNTSGILLQVNNLQKSSFNLNLSELQPGTYIIKLVSGHESVTKKISVR